MVPSEAVALRIGRVGRFLTQPVSHMIPASFSWAVLRHDATLRAQSLPKRW